MATRARKASATSKASDPGGAEEAPGGDGAPVDFEASLGRLEEIVDALEQGELPLEESLRRFEEGVRLTRECAGQLEAVERRIEILMEEAGEWVARPFEDAADVDDPADDDVDED